MGTLKFESESIYSLLALWGDNPLTPFFALHNQIRFLMSFCLWCSARSALIEFPFHSLFQCPTCFLFPENQKYISLHQMIQRHIIRSCSNMYHRLRLKGVALFLNRERDIKWKPLKWLKLFIKFSFERICNLLFSLYSLQLCSWELATRDEMHRWSCAFGA